MAALVENMFSVRMVPWHKMGIILENYPSFDDAIIYGGLNFLVEKVHAVQRLHDGTIRELADEYEIRRVNDGQHYGYVKEGYVILQNEEMFDLGKAMIGEGAKIETAGSLKNGEVVWFTAKTEGTTFAEEFIQDYYLITNTHGGGGAIRAAITPIRTVCCNTLNAALANAKRTWSYKHTTNVMSRVDEAIQTLKNGETYMAALGEEISAMKLAKITESKAREVLDMIVVEETGAKLAKIEQLKKVTPFSKDEQLKNLEKITKLQQDVVAVRDDLYARYFDAPDLQHLDNNQFRLWNAISDYATHTDLHKNTREYNQRMFMSIANGNTIGKAKLIDLGYKLAKAA